MIVPLRRHNSVCKARNVISTAQLWKPKKQAQFPQKANCVSDFPYSNLPTKQLSDCNGASQTTCVWGDSTLMQMF